MSRMPRDPLRASSILPDGRRLKIRMADVAGRFTRLKAWIFPVLMLVYAALPLIRIGGQPAVFIDIGHRRFYLLGMVFNSQDAHLIFFLLTGAIFSLFYLTALYGRVWCGFACPQTVFLEGVFRRIERWIEGSRSAQIHLARAPWSLGKAGKLGVKHGLYLVAAFLIAHIFLSYFVSADHLFLFMNGNPLDHPTAFIWMLAITTVVYFNFAWFREQLCLIVCPYGRLQSVLIDDDAIVVGYDAVRGEPRGKKHNPRRGDCINCRRCIDVCPTGIDIREGLQLECLGCANCIDACDAVMAKIGQSSGLIRYDSQNGLAGKRRRLLRPRIFFYTALLLLGAAIFVATMINRQGFDANLMRLQGAPYVRQGAVIRNQYTIHMVNKSPKEASFSIVPRSKELSIFILPNPTLILKSLEDRQIPLFVEMPEAAFSSEFTVSVTITNRNTGKTLTREIPFLGPEVE